MSRSFIDFFGRDALGKTKNYYAISKINTKINFKNYFDFLKKNKLKFKILNNLDYSEKIEESIISEEKNLKYFKIKNKIKKKLMKNKINLYLNKPFLKNYVQNYDKIVVACYDQNNIILKQLGIKPKKKI